jgi:hypothetical protein
MHQRVTVFLGALLLTSVASAQGPPSISSLSPSGKIAGFPGFTLTMNGSGFCEVVGGPLPVPPAVTFGGATITGVVFVNATQLTAPIPAASIATQGTAQVVVTNPPCGGSLASAPANFTIAAPITITTPSPPPATVGVAVNQTLNATGGFPPYTWFVTGGTLPTGLFLNSTGGQINNTPSAAGTFTFGLQVLDSLGNSHTQPGYSWIVNPAPAITTLFLPGVTTGAPYNQTVVANGGTLPRTFSLNPGPLPPGLSLNPATGAITGTAGAAGDYPFAVTVTDANGATASQAYTITVNPAPAIATLSLPDITTGFGYNQVVVATGGTPPRTFSLNPGPLPPGLSLNSATGAITGTAGAAGSYPFTVTVTDGNGVTASQAYTITVNPAPAIATLSLPNVTTGTAYNQTVVATSGTPPRTFSLNPGPLPPGLGLNSATGAITGTAGAAGSYPFTITVTDANGATASQAYTITVNPAPAITTLSLPNVTTGAAYTQTVVATGGTPPRTFSLNPGPLPPGLSLNPATGAITGTAGAAGSYPFTVRVTDASGASASQAYTITVDPLPTYTITISVSPAGGGTASCVPNPVTQGDSSTCTATANAPYTFTGWSGDCTGASCTLSAVTSAKSVTATFQLRTFSGPSATGSGTITASFSTADGGPTCGYSVSRFLAVSDVAAPPPADTIFPHGLFDFAAGGCAPGSTLNFTMTYPQALPPSARYWKYGPTPGDPAPHWYVLPAAIGGNQATFSITDGGLGDDDLTANGTIVDQGGPGSGGASDIPTLSGWGLVLLSLALAAAGAARLLQKA